MKDLIKLQLYLNVWPSHFYLTVIKVIFYQLGCNGYVNFSGNAPYALPYVQLNNNSKIRL